MKGAAEYIDASKDTWRGWKWNAIAHAALQFNDRLPPAERARRLSQKTVLYLVGPEDHDRRKALAKGFANHNLIAVDICQERIDEVRAVGGLGICGSLQNILLSWPQDWPVDVVDADFCGGLVNDIGELPFCFNLCRGAYAETVVSMNLLRGRDPHSNSTRENVRNTTDWLARALSKSGADIGGVDLAKHRGVNWLTHLANCWGQVRDCAAGVDSAFDEKGRKGVLISERELSDWICNVWNPQLGSYRSKTSGQVFDSVVHRWGMVVVDQDGVSKQEWRDNQDAVRKKLSRIACNNEGVRERIAALRAVRTMKIKKVQT